MVIKDLLTRCNLTFSLCRGQAYDGAANIQGKRSGVAARFLSENSSRSCTLFYPFTESVSSGIGKKCSVYQGCYRNSEGSW